MKNIALGTHFQGLNRQYSFKGLLDIYEGAAAAYSLRKLSKATTSVVRVRRDSDNAEADFTAQEITDGTLEAFCTGTDGLVTTWYDQSGNGNDATQSIAASQPKIVSSGSLLLRGGKPSMQFDGVNDNFITSQNNPFTFTGGVSIIHASYKNATAYKDYETILSAGTTGSSSSNANKSLGIGYNNSSTNPKPTISTDIWSPSGIQYDGTVLTGEHNLIGFYISNWSTHLSTGLSNLTLNNSDLITKPYFSTNPLALNTNPIKIGVFDKILATSFFGGEIQEVIAYASDKNSDRIDIQANINKAFNIYWDGTQKGLLDTYTGAEAAYSLRALNSAYTGAILKVRRASDNAEQDIYAKWDGTLNVDALETFCAATDGYVVTWYDQSGNANNATQATAASQPQIVSSGSIITDSGYQVIQYDGIDDNLGTSFTATGTMLMGGTDGGAFYPVAISGAYDLLGSALTTKHPLKESIRVIWGRTLSAGEQSAIESRVTYSDWDFSNVTSFNRYWRQRSGLTSFPLIDTSNGVNFSDTWALCSITSLPELDFSNGTTFVSTWRACTNLTSFPAVNFNNATTFNQAWSTCVSLQDFPANMFDSVTATDFTNAFLNTNLTQTSIDNILVSIDTAGQSGGTFTQSGGSAPSAVGEAAIDSLIAKGWTITVTGIYDTLGAFLYRVETDGGIVEDEANLRQELTDLNI